MRSPTTKTRACFACWAGNTFMPPPRCVWADRFPNCYNQDTANKNDVPRNHIYGKSIGRGAQYAYELPNAKVRDRHREQPVERRAYRLPRARLLASDRAPATWVGAAGLLWQTSTPARNLFAYVTLEKPH